VDLDFKSLSVEEEQFLRAVLKSCLYLHASAKWNVGEDVLRKVAGDIAHNYGALERATAVKTKVSK